MEDYFNASQPSSNASDWIIKKKIKAVGVTFENPNGENRQDILRDLAEQYGQDLFLADIDLAEYKYQGEPAYHILINNKVVGNVSANLAKSLKKAQIEYQYTFWLEDGFIIGGEFYEENIDADDEFAEYFDENDKFNSFVSNPHYGVMFTLCLASPYARKLIISELDKQYKKQENNCNYNPVMQNSKTSTNKPKNIWKVILGAFLFLVGLFSFGQSTIVMDINIIIGALFIIWWIAKDMELDE